MAQQYIELVSGKSSDGKNSPKKGSDSKSSRHKNTMRADDLALIGRHLSARSGLVLDAGCGPGHLTDHLRSLDIDAIGIDLVPEFMEHARAAYPTGRYALGSMSQLPVPDQSIAGILCWFSLIHLPPNDIGSVLAELRRVAAPEATLVTGFFHGEEILPFGHKVTTAYYWPVDELSARLKRAGFTEVERLARPGVDESGRRPPAALAAVAN